MCLLLHGASRCLDGVAATGVTIPARFVVRARDLMFIDRDGGSLALRSPLATTAEGSSLGEGFFGSVGQFRHHGTPVAVKELKIGSLDVASLGVCANCVWFTSGHTV